MAGTGRRKLMLFAGAALFVVGWQRFMVRPDPLEFQPLSGAPGWEFATAGAVSGLSDLGLVTIGLDRGPEPLAAERLEAVVHRDHAGGVPIAVFSDFFCPYCRELNARVRVTAARGPEMSVSWHELPLLGPNSELAARAAEAAALQGGYVAFQERLLADGFRPLPSWMGQVAARAGLDGERLVAEMDGPKVGARLEASAAAAARLGFFATPGLVVDRKAVLGAVGRERFAALLSGA